MRIEWKSMMVFGGSVLLSWVPPSPSPLSLRARALLLHVFFLFPVVSHALFAFLFPSTFFTCFFFFFFFCCYFIFIILLLLLILFYRGMLFEVSDKFCNLLRMEFFLLWAFRVLRSKSKCSWGLLLLFKTTKL